MSKELHMRGNDGNLYSFENIKTQGWLDGHIPGVEAAQAWLMGKAIEAFRLGNDEEATALRDAARQMPFDLLPPLKAKAQKHKEEYPEEVPEKVKR